MFESVHHSWCRCVLAFGFLFRRCLYKIIRLKPSESSSNVGRCSKINSDCHLVVWGDLISFPRRQEMRYINEKWIETVGLLPQQIVLGMLSASVKTSRVLIWLGVKQPNSYAMIKPTACVHSFLWIIFDESTDVDLNFAYFLIIENCNSCNLRREFAGDELFRKRNYDWRNLKPIFRAIRLFVHNRCVGIGKQFQFWNKFIFR